MRLNSTRLHLLNVFTYQVEQEYKKDEKNIRINAH